MRRKYVDIRGRDGSATKVAFNSGTPDLNSHSLYDQPYA